MHWFPLDGQRKGNAADFMALSCTDGPTPLVCVQPVSQNAPGTFKFVDKSGKVKLSVNAHTGAVIALRWNLDGQRCSCWCCRLSCCSEGTALATCGEDGVVKEWSRSGEKRSTLAETGQSQASCSVWPNA